jgi:hypothetical protein
MTFYYIVEKLKLDAGIHLSDEHIKNIELINAQVTSETQQALQKKIEIDGLASGLKEKIIAFKSKKIPFSVKVARKTDSYVRNQLQEIVDQFEHYGREASSLSDSAKPLKEIETGLLNSILELNQSILATRTYHKNLIEFNDYLTQLALSQPGSNAGESAGTLFSLIAQEVQSASRSISIQEANRGLLKARLSETQNLYNEISLLGTVSLEVFLLDSGFSESSAKDLLAKSLAKNIPSPPKEPLNQRLGNKVKNLNSKGYAVVLASLVGLGYGGWTGVDHYQDYNFDAQLTSQNAKAGSMLKAVRSMADPETRNAQLAKLVDTYKDQLSPEQVLEITKEVTNDRWEHKETRATAILKNYSDYLSSKNNIVDMEKRAPGIIAMLEQARQTSDERSANSAIYATYQKYKNVLTVEDVAFLKTFFKQIYQNTPPDESYSVDRDFANVLRDRPK